MLPAAVLVLDAKFSYAVSVLLLVCLINAYASLREAGADKWLFRQRGGPAPVRRRAQALSANAAATD